MREYAHDLSQRLGRPKDAIANGFVFSVVEVVRRGKGRPTSIG
jgi:hypothetical protein